MRLFARRGRSRMPWSGTKAKLPNPPRRPKRVGKKMGKKKMALLITNLVGLGP